MVLPITASLLADGPTLRAALKVTSLQSVTAVECQCDSTTADLSLLGKHLPSLKTLKASQSFLPTLHCLGADLRRLSVLWVSRCELGSLSGLSSLPSLKELYASFNAISDLSPLEGACALEVLDLEGNQISTFSEVDCLITCTSLISLSLLGNPLHEDMEYTRVVTRKLPGLHYLDDEPVGCLKPNDPYTYLRDEAMAVTESIKSQNEKSLSCPFRELSPRVTPRYTPLDAEPCQLFCGNPTKALKERKRADKQGTPRKLAVGH